MQNPKRILFITPPYHAGVVESAGSWMPLSFVYLAGAVREAGYEPVIYDAMSKKHTMADIEQYLSDNSFDYLAITAITSSIVASLDVLQAARKIQPAIKTVVGGVHPTFCYNELFEMNGNEIDYIVFGEGELTLPDLLQTIDRAGDLTKVRGIVYQNGHEIIKTAPRKFVEDLDSLPTAWDLIEWEDYRYYVIPGSRLAAIGTSRGCTHGCTFCSQQKFWDKSWRGRNPEKIVDEIIMLKESYSANVFLIVDEYPTNDRERWEKFLDLLIEQKLDIYLLMETRVEDIVRDQDILHKYRQAGIVHIYIGVEATDQERLDLIQKDLDVKMSKQAIDLIHEHGMITETSFVIGFPTDTEETIERTLKLAQFYAPDFAHFLAITPWPYADIYNDTKAFIAVDDYSKYNLVEPIIKPAAMSLEEIRKAILSSYRRYYMRKVPDYMKEKNAFKRDYLKRSMKLIMKNSFLSELISSFGEHGEFDKMHRMID